MTTVSRPDIDPRIRRRRIEVARETGRRRLRRLLALLGVLGLAVALTGVALSPLLDVDRIEVAGSMTTPVAEVLRAAGIEQGDAMVRIDVGAASDRVEALPWVESVVIRRDYPSTVEVEVVERTPVGILRTSGGEVLVDRSGRVLGPVALGYGDLPRLEVDREVPAPGGRVGEQTRSLLPLLATISEGVEGHDVAVRQDAEGAVSLRVDQAIDVVLGAVGDADSQLDTKLRALDTVLDQVDLTCVEVIDVRVADRPVLTRDEPCQ